MGSDWPDPARLGWPLNPECSGWHVVAWPDDQPTLWQWSAHGIWWDEKGPPEDVATWSVRYIGAVMTPQDWKERNNGT